MGDTNTTAEVESSDFTKGIEDTKVVEVKDSKTEEHIAPKEKKPKEPAKSLTRKISTEEQNTVYLKKVQRNISFEKAEPHESSDLQRETDETDTNVNETPLRSMDEKLVSKEKQEGKTVSFSETP